MDEWPEDEPVSFHGRKLPDHVACRQTMIGESCQLSHDPREWADALVVVESGELELECYKASAGRAGVAVYSGGFVPWRVDCESNAPPRALPRLFKTVLTDS